MILDYAGLAREFLPITFSSECPISPLFDGGAGSFRQNFGDHLRCADISARAALKKEI